MERYLYFDSASTAAPSASALAAVSEAYTYFGNPSSEHKAGLDARRLLVRARTQVASALRCDPKELIFTSSGTEASNTALFGLARARGKRAKKILSTDSEHPSVELPLQALETQGFRVVRIGTKNGVLDLERLERELQEPIAFVTMMRANNETGALYDLYAVKKALQNAASDAPLHCDAVQSFLKVEDKALCSVCDLVTLSAHKIGGVKGAGALYCNQKIKNLPPYLLGGGQENGMRSGTENVAAIAAFGAAAEEKSHDKARLAVIAERKEYLISNLSEMGLHLHLPENALPNILHLSVPGVQSAWAVNFLSERGICVSAGSACSSNGRKKGNRVLEAFGLPKAEIETSLRISFSENTTKEECALLCDALRECAKLKK